MNAVPQHSFPDLPHDVELEQALIGAALVDEIVLDDVAGHLETQDLFDPLHRRMWAAMLEMRARGSNVTPLTVAAELQGDSGLEEVGGISYLKSIARASSARPNIKDYARVLRDLSLRRALIVLGMDAAEAAARPLAEAPIKEQVTRIEEGLLWVMERAQGFSESARAGDAAMQALQDAEDARKSKKPWGARTGVAALDEKIGGLEPSKLIIVAGRPGMGKSTLATTLARAAAKGGRAVEFFSLEMSERELSLRLACDVDYDSRGNEIPLSYSRISKAQAGDRELERAWNAAARLRELSIAIHDRDSLTMPEIAAIAKSRAARAKGPGVIIVDHLHIISALDRYRGNRVQELTEITKQAKQLAKRLGWPVVLLAQLSRDAEKRVEKERRPMLSDLRDSGSIEQDADVVIGLYRPAYYLEQTRPRLGKADPKWTEWEVSYRELEHELELSVLKNRGGPTGKVDAFCDMRSSVIRDIEQHEGARGWAA